MMAMLPILMRPPSDQKSHRESKNMPHCSFSIYIWTVYVQFKTFLFLLSVGFLFQNKCPLAFLWTGSRHFLKQWFNSEIFTIFCCGKCSLLLQLFFVITVRVKYRIICTGTGTIIQMWALPNSNVVLLRVPTELSWYYRVPIHIKSISARFW